jgi:hypothetical protein
MVAAACADHPFQIEIKAQGVVAPWAFCFSGQLVAAPYLRVVRSWAALQDKQTALARNKITMPDRLPVLVEIYLSQRSHNGDRLRD